jgi:hypothetical protein
LYRTAVLYSGTGTILLSICYALPDEGIWPFPFFFYLSNMYR